MNSKAISGLVGIVVGGAWLVWNLQHLTSQGYVAIAMPLLICVLGAVYFFRSRDES
ncbi:hypothetical protein [Tahibacter amnicola]|uniref:Uncharacterized protein n=1 Tax=Tahibacter amnicola TaxID=2976241 RepID=A0ABY6BJ73_9GAMM|nr:hypothetical protein [Tahibacter amnicola]UXI70069.1 hypothetical protein N4264_10710 [Tahibacter amnicola]